jgi:hypothetical protein
MEVYYSGYGFIYDTSLDEVDEQNHFLVYGNEIAYIEKVTRHKYRGHFILPAHVLQDLKFIEKAKVSYLLYKEDDDAPINVRGWEEAIDPKNARLYLSDSEGNCCPIKIKMDCTDNQFNEEQPDNTLRLFQNGELQIIKEIPSCLNKAHEMYSEELAAAIETWKSVLQCNPPRPKTGSRKSLIEKHLNNNYSTFNKSQRDRITLMINPDKGGAPKSI